MTTKRTEQDFINLARDSFETSVQELDSDTLSDLAAIRAHALARRPAPHRQLLLVPAAALIFIGLTIAIYNTLLSPASRHAPVQNDIELMSAQEGLELYDDVEFYEWLEDSEYST